MTYLLTAAQMRAWEQAAITSGEVTGLELMERAGRGAVDAILAEWPDLATGTHPALILCGPGNNGGDGFVVARLLAERGWDVDCLFYGDADKLPPDARANYDRWVEIGAVAQVGYPQVDFDRFEEFTVSRAKRLEATMKQEDHPVFVVVDALFGIGLTRPLHKSVCETLVEAYVPDGDIVPTLPDESRYVALDVPTGFNADTGRFYNAAFEAHLCVTFQTLKTGHLLGDMPGAVRKVAVVDLQLPPMHDPAFYQCRKIEAPRDHAGIIFPHLYGWPGKTRSPKVSGGFQSRHDAGLNKFDHGHALVLAGGVGRGGAARLAARAALRIGAGLVTVAPPPAALIENACHLDAIMLHRMPDAAALQDMLSDERINALCVGPGFGLTEREAAIVATIIRAGKTCVLDADALTLIAGDAGMAKALHPKCVLTPHLGEFARLAPDLAEKLKAPAEQGPAYSKLDATRDLAARLGCVVLLKGSDTVIADPTGRAAIHAAAYGRQVPWLATAGAGDVLAGIITGLLARGFDPMTACESASWLHVEAARQFGPGLISEDLPEALPAVLRGLQVDQDAT